MQTVLNKYSPIWGKQQLALIIEAKALGEPIRTLKKYGKIIKALIKETQRSKHFVFATLGTRSDQGHSCPCKDSRTEKHPWAPSDCSLLELAITGSTSREIEHPSDAQLKAIRERLNGKGYEKLKGILEKKGWVEKKKWPGLIVA